MHFILRTIKTNLPRQWESARNFLLRTTSSRLSFAIAATSAAFIVTRVARLAQSVILARMISSEAFGRAGIVLLSLQALEMFSDLGLGQACITHPHGGRLRFLETAWSMQIGRGGLLSGIMLMISPVIAEFHGDVSLQYMLGVASLSPLILGLRSPAVFRLERQIQLKQLSIIESSAQLLGLGMAVSSVLVTRSAWPIIIGHLTYCCCVTSLSHICLRHIAPARFFVDRAYSLALLQYALWIVLSSSLGFVSQQADRLIMAAAMNPNDFGEFMLATSLSGTVAIGCQLLIRRVYMPLVAECNNKLGVPSEIARRCTRLRLFIVGSGALATAVLVLFNQEITYLLFGASHPNVEKYLYFTAIISFSTVLVSSQDTILLARHKPSQFAIWLGVRAGSIAITGGLLAWYICPLLALISAIGINFAIYLAIRASASRGKLPGGTVDVIPLVVLFLAIWVERVL